MISVQKKIQDTARRIHRLGRYAGDPQTRWTTKAKGILVMNLGPEVSWAVACELGTGRVWIRNQGEDQPEWSPEQGFEWMGRYEAALLEQATAKAREEVISELVNRRIRRVLRAQPKSLGKVRQTV